MYQNAAKKDFVVHLTGMVKAERSKRLCPFIQNPHKDCYINHMNSLSVETIIKYCGESFEECPIYKRLMEGKS